MKRKIYEALIDWKSNPNQSLMIKGARQVGKTYVIKEFGRNEFNHVLYINFEDELELRNVFETMASPVDAIKTLQAVGVSQNIFNITSNETLIFLDEIQLSKRTYSLLKPLTELKKYKIIVSGSLLGVNINEDFLDPGPTVKHLTMYPMDFEEFLWALKGDEIKLVIETIKSQVKNKETILETLHQTFNQYIIDYVVVGGMPQVVYEYIKSEDLGTAYLNQEPILKLYQSDIQRYQTSHDNKIKTLKCFNSIPSQFSKNNHRFMYSVVQEKKNARYFGNAIDWLEQTGNVHKSYQINHLKGSLIHGQSHLFKLFLNDIGLLTAMMGKDYIYKIIHHQLNLFKGALYEQLTAQILLSKNMPLYYMAFNDYEIDFLFEKEGTVYPIECKSGTNTKSKSLKVFMNHYKNPKGFKLSFNNINTSDEKIKAIPYYLFAFLTMDELITL